MKKNGYDPQKYGPIDVKRIPNSGRYEIIDGHHRAAAIKAGIKNVPIRILGP
jgi:ParB-like chromosome segregation protein Spo0J